MIVSKCVIQAVDWDGLECKSRALVFALWFEHGDYFVAGRSGIEQLRFALELVHFDCLEVNDVVYETKKQVEVRDDLNDNP